MASIIICGYGTPSSPSPQWPFVFKDSQSEAQNFQHYLNGTEQPCKQQKKSKVRESKYAKEKDGKKKKRKENDIVFGIKTQSYNQ